MANSFQKGLLPPSSEKLIAIAFYNAFLSIIGLFLTNKNIILILSLLINIILIIAVIQEAKKPRYSFQIHPDDMRKK